MPRVGVLAPFSRFVPLLLTAAIGVFKANAQTLTTLVNFNGANGARPDRAVLVQASDGNLYGTTLTGGVGNWGTVFRLTPAGVFTVLHSFGLGDGAFPDAPLTLAKDGNFYGTTVNGGFTPAGNVYHGAGTVFRITPAGVLTTLYTFAGPDGELTNAGLLQAPDGSFYGSTIGATDGGGNLLNYGSIFRVTANGSLSTIYTFHGADGSAPYAELVQGTDGNFYGTTAYGGTYGTVNYIDGTVFRITPAGVFTSLYSFSGTDGQDPSGLMLASDGNLYGTTGGGGTNGLGTIFKISMAGVLTTLHNFTRAEGFGPVGPLLEASDGNFYGVTYTDVASQAGTIFRMTTSGSLTTLYHFGGGDGSNPSGGLIQGVNGHLYGTTQFGGTANMGTVFDFVPPAAPFINPGGVVPLYSSSPVIQPGSWISIYGGNLATSTTVWQGDFPTSLGGVSVAIDGKPCYLWLVSPGQINLQTPDDLTRGPVSVVVTTPKGSATSTVTLGDFAPSFSLLDGRHPTALILTPNGSGAYGNGAYDLLGPAGQFSFPTRPVNAGETLVLFGVGFGPVSPAVLSGRPFSGSAPTVNAVQIRVGGITANVLYSGLTSAGLFQFNLVAPVTGSGDQPLTAIVGGVSTTEQVAVTVQ